MRSAESFYRCHHIQTVEAVIRERLDGAEFFGVQCGQPYYFRFVDGFLEHSGTYVKSDWYKTRYTSVRQANANGVIEMYNLNELLSVYEKQTGKSYCDIK